MSYRVIGLGKLLRTLYADKSEQTRLLREDIRREIKKEKAQNEPKPVGKKKSGGDFYGPFWADAKRHVIDKIDLREITPQRIESNDTRERLYQKLRDGFLLWWEENRRLRNEPYTIIDENVKARHEAGDLGTVKVENTLAFKAGDDRPRIVCPYFCEDPSLSEEAARLGLWVMSQCIQGYALEDMRLLDVIAGRTYSVLDTPLLGVEHADFMHSYGMLLQRWDELRATY